MPINLCLIPPIELIGPVDDPTVTSLPLHDYFSASNGAYISLGFYTVDRLHADQLILGPFQGKVACQTISFGRGVCGTAAAEKKTVRVSDVESFPGHIACDGESKSEIVVPLVWEGKVSPPL